MRSTTVKSALWPTVTEPKSSAAGSTAASGVAAARPVTVMDTFCVGWVASLLVKRNVPLKALSWGKTEQALSGTVRQRVTMQQGIPTEKAREIVKLIKQLKVKVQASIQGEQVRVSGKAKDDLQAVMQMLRANDLGIDMQFTNYR